MICAHGNEYEDCGACYDDARALSEEAEGVYVHPDGGVIMPKDFGRFTRYELGSEPRVDSLLAMVEAEFLVPLRDVAIRY